MAEIRDQYLLDIDQALRQAERIQDEFTQIESSITESSQASGNMEADFRGVASALDISEAEARALTGQILESQSAARRTEAEARDLARALDLSEDDARALASSLGRVSTEARQADDSAGRLQSSLGNVRNILAAGVAAVGFREVVRGIDDAVQAASDLEQSIGGVQSVFGDANRDILDFGATAADSVGLAESAANTLASQLGGQLQTFGFSAQEAATETQNLISLGSDLAATYGGPVSSAVEAIGSLLRGEINPIERYAVAVNQASIQAEGLRLGLAESTSALTIQDRALAALSLLYEQTGNAQGQFAREAGTTAGQLERLRAEAENTKAEVGEALTPAYLAFVDAARRSLPDIRAAAVSISELAGAAEAGEGPLLTFTDVIAGLATGRGFGVLTDIGATIVSGITTPAEIATEAVRDLLDPDFEGDLVGQLTEVGSSIGSLIDNLQQRAILESFISDLKEGVDPALAFANATAATARNNDLTADSFDRLAQISGVGDARLRDAVITMLDAGEAAGFSAQEIAVLEDKLRRLDSRLGLRPEDLDRDRFDPNADLSRFDVDDGPILNQFSAFNLLAGAADEAGVSVRDLIGDYDTLSPELQEAADAVGGLDVAFLDQGNAIQDLRGEIDQLGGALDAAAAALEDKEGEIVEDFSTFLSNLQSELAAREAFESNLATLRVLGLDNLAQVFDDAGLDAASALADAVANPADAQRAEDELRGQGESQGAASVEGITSAIDEGRLDITSSLIDTIIAAAAAADSPATRQALLDLAEALRFEIPGVVAIDVPDHPTSPSSRGSGGGTDTGGGGGGDTTTNVNVDVTLQSTGETVTDAARVAQTTSDIISRVQ